MRRNVGRNKAKALTGRRKPPGSRRFKPAARRQSPAIGNLAGNWDSVKLGQVVSNLVANAIEHDAQREPVVLTVWGEDDRMPVAVHNEGAPITGATLENLGNPLAGRRLEDRGTSTRVKLGLFIAREILAAHDGRLP